MAYCDIIIIIDDFFLFVTLFDRTETCFVAILKELFRVLFSCRVKMDAEKATVALKEVKAC